MPCANVPRPLRWRLWEIIGDNSIQCCCPGSQGAATWETNNRKHASTCTTTLNPEHFWRCSKVRIQSISSWHQCVFPVFPPGTPSPVPPLPERTLKSFELATDQGGVTHQNPGLNLLTCNLLWCLSFLTSSSSRPEGHVGGGREWDPPGVPLATCCFFKQCHETFFEK